MKPRVFVGSSRESLEYARAIQLELEHDMHVDLWDQGIFRPGDYTLQRLLQQSERFHFGIFVFSPDDVVKMRKEEHLAARDNVLFEFGLFVSRMGLQRAFFITPAKTDAFHLPTDLMGVTPGSYDPDRIPRDNVTAMGLQPVFAPAAARIRSTIQQQWQYSSPLQELTDRLIFLLRHLERQPTMTSYVGATWGPVMAAFVDRPRKFPGVHAELSLSEGTAWSIAAEYACWLLRKLGMIEQIPQGSYMQYQVTADGRSVLQWDRAQKQFPDGFAQPLVEPAKQG